MTKQETYDFLDAKNIEYEITEHKAVFSMDEVCDVVLPHPECDAKNLFVRDDKKRGYFLITVKGNKRVDLKEFRKVHGTRPLSFASAEEYAAWVAKMKSQSTFTSDTEVTVDDRVITLSTCTYEYDNARFVVQGKLVPLAG